ncbi:MAG: ATP-binding protein [Acidobacteriia bacterium]|nr:ATP-binding protein [Terriglobia bacterium]
MGGEGGMGGRRTFGRSVEALPAVFAFIEGFFAAEAIDRRHLLPVELAVEEIFTNVIRHGRGRGDGVGLDLERKSDRLLVSVTEFDADPFDVTKFPEARIDLPLQDRLPGGLGVHLANKMVDRVEYEYAGRTSRTTLIKNLG